MILKCKYWCWPAVVIHVFSYAVSITVRKKIYLCLQLSEPSDISFRNFCMQTSNIMGIVPVCLPVFWNRILLAYNLENFHCQDKKKFMWKFVRNVTLWGLHELLEMYHCFKKCIKQEKCKTQKCRFKDSLYPVLYLAHIMCIQFYGHL